MKACTIEATEHETSILHRHQISAVTFPPCSIHFYTVATEQPPLNNNLICMLQQPKHLFHF